MKQGFVAKPAKAFKPGDCLHIRAGKQEWEVIGRGLNAQRRPVPEARLLHQQTTESPERRMRVAKEQGAYAGPDAGGGSEGAADQARRVAEEQVSKE